MTLFPEIIIAANLIINFHFNYLILKAKSNLADFTFMFWAGKHKMGLRKYIAGSISASMFCQRIKFSEMRLKFNNAFEMQILHHNFPMLVILSIQFWYLLQHIFVILFYPSSDFIK